MDVSAQSCVRIVTAAQVRMPFRHLAPLRTSSCALALASLLCIPAAATEEIFAKRPAFSWGDLPAERAATCEEVRTMAEGLPEDSDMRIDLTVIGKLELVKSDGVLWYLGLCALPGVRILCVAYESNDMKVGDTVYMKGGYRRTGPDHVLLDPCLANRPEEGETPPSKN